MHGQGPMGRRGQQFPFARVHWEALPTDPPPTLGTPARGKVVIPEFFAEFTSGRLPFHHRPPFAARQIRSLSRFIASHKADWAMSER